jgi:hypothetical protein
VGLLVALGVVGLIVATGGALFTTIDVLNSLPAEERAIVACEDADLDGTAASKEQYDRCLEEERSRSTLDGFLPWLALVVGSIGLIVTGYTLRPPPS